MENLITESHFKDKVVLVTGSSRGIGAATAIAFAKHGAKVVLHGRDGLALKKVQDVIAALGGDATIAIADLNKFDEIEAMREQIQKDLGEVDILVANAGGSFTPPAPLEEIPEEGWRASVDGNLTVTFLTLKSFLSAMKKRKSGHIITMSSSAGRRPHAMAPIPYGAAKAAITMLTQDVAAQVGPYGIHVNCIAPGTILTERNISRIPEGQQKAMVDYHPIKRLGTPEDVANAAIFLASENASWITGTVLDIAGGAVMI
ncbi:SDR family NAD(P)-dependent oxidoreductase [Taibaiella koreensis]|uniref:SDR family NAD(P)-dependent oxidoreductase n=1 Tax=Taibaiella koreensis TaxID=1268548 RepID=UPI000E59AABC|nr:SDR family oxidoreductase [Taibaiella koreensis]